MKAFVVVALLVASVAGQNLDLFRYRNMDRTGRNLGLDTTVEDLLLKEKLMGRHVVDYDTLYNTFDLTKILGRDTTVLPIDVLVNHPIFREYLRLPLFRKMLVQHPVVFKKYIESPLFQKFWMVPEFEMYFRNPVLFYKYIVPQIQVIYKTIVPVTRDIYNYDDMYTTKNMNIDDMYTMNKKVDLPYVYNRDMTTMDKVLYNTFPQTHTVGLRYLLEKMINRLNINKVHGLETLTDIKMLPTGQVYENTLGKMVDPITGEEKITLGDLKVVDEKMIPVKNTMDFLPLGLNKITRKDMIKDLLVKKIILSKILGDKVITPEVLAILFGEHKEVIPEVYKHLYNLKNIMTPEVLYNLYNTHKVVLPEVYETLFDNKKVLHPFVLDTLFNDVITKKYLTPEIFETLFKGKKNIITPEILETIFGKKIYTPEVFGTLFNTKKVVIPDVLKYNVDVDDVDTIKMNPIVDRMIMNRRFSPKMDVVMTKKMIDEIKKEKMVDEIMMNKDLVKDFTLDTLEYPKMVDTEKVLRHVPLTYDRNTMILPEMIRDVKDIKDIKF